MGDVGSDYASEELHFHEYLKDQISLVESDDKLVVDTLVNYLYNENSRYKDTLWRLYGDILLENLSTNIEGTIFCVNCNTRKDKNGESIYCVECYKDVKAQQDRERKRRKYQENKKFSGTPKR